MRKAAPPRPVGELIDELGAVRAQQAALKIAEAGLRDAILAHRVGEAEGKIYRFTLISATRSTLDVDRVRREMGEQWYENMCRSTATTSLRVTPRREVLAAALAEAA